MISTENGWQQARALIRSAKRIVVLTGAGISAESGIATFRDEQGFWKRFPPEEFANWKGLLQMAALQPKRFGEFVLAILEPIALAEPNSGHQAIVELAKEKSIAVITQNIDGLHQAAGSQTVHEIHGSLFEIVNFSGSPQSTVTREQLRQIVEDVKYACESGWTGPRLMLAICPLFGMDARGVHRPNLVLFGDVLAEPAWSRACEAVSECDVLLAVGTSGSVAPAASLPELAVTSGADVITVDPHVNGTGIWLAGTAGDILPRLVAEIGSA